VDFLLPPETEQLARELRRAAEVALTRGAQERDGVAEWRQLVEFGFFEIERSGGTSLDVACALMATSFAPMPGPIVEAELAVTAAPEQALDSLRQHQIVTSVTPSCSGRTPVAWGARASLVIDRTNGSVLSRHPLPQLSNAFGLPLGWWFGEGSGEPDPLVARRWMLSAAACTGLATGAFQMTLNYTRDRHVFGKPLSSRQAAQMRLAECKVLLEGCEVAVRDAGWRAGTGRYGDESAALAWLYALDATETVMGHCHQLFGALGFCDETGLFDYSSQCRWLRLASPAEEAVSFIMNRRDLTESVPPSLVLRGFRQPS
jgi:hypothetical protein